MADAVVGSVSVDVVPSAETFWSDFKTQTTPGARKAGDDLGDALGPPIASSVRDAVEKGLTESGPAVKEQGSQQGAAFGDAFDKQVVSRLEAALKNLPKAELDADLGPIDAKLADLRTKLELLGKEEFINLGYNDESVLAYIDTLRAELDELTTPEHDIRVRVNAGAASAELVGLQAQLDKLSRDSGGPGGVGSDLAGLGSGASSAGKGIYQFLLPAIAAASTLVGPLVAVGAAGVGTLLLGFSGLKDEVQSGLTPAFHELESVATDALRPGIGAAVSELQLALPKLQPLIQVFGSEIGNVATDLATWLNNGGLTGFVQYAERELPIVEGALSALTRAGIGFFDAVTPLGNVFLEVLTKVANTFSTIAGFAGQLQSGASSGAGPSSSGSRSTTGSQLGYAFSTTGGYAPKPKTTGDYFAGIGHDIVTFFNSEGQPSSKPKTAAKAPDPAAVLAASAASTQQKLTDATAASFGATTSAYQAASTAAQAFATQTAATTIQMQLENNAAGLLSQALQGLGGDNLGVAQATTQFQTGLQTLGATLTQNSDTIDGNSAAALANQAAIQQQVAAAQAVYQATVKQTGSTEEGKAAYDAAITSIENATGATGKNKDAIDAYIQKIGDIPPLKETQIDLNLDAANAALADFKTRLDSVQSKVITISVAGSSDPVSLVETPGGGVKRLAAGGFVTGAGTGTSDSVPILASAGEFVMPANVAAQYGPQLQAMRAGNYETGGGYSASVTSSGGQPQVIYRDITFLMDGQTVTKIVNEQNGQNGRR